MARRRSQDLRPGDDPAAAVERIYRHGKNYAGGQPHPQHPDYEESMTEPEHPEDWELSPRTNTAEVQTHEDAHAPGYDNDTSEGWLTGHGSPHPYFDSTDTSRNKRR